MQSILKAWIGHRGEHVGVYVTQRQVCYWRLRRENVFARVELGDWLAGDWAEKVFFYTSKSSAIEIKAFVQGVVDRAACEWDD